MFEMFRKLLLKSGRPRRLWRTLLSVERLEDRAVPAVDTCVWEGDLNDNWINEDNWDGGFVPDYDDIAVFTTIAAGNSSPRIYANDFFEVGRMETMAGFAGKTLTLDGTLQVNDQLVQSHWDQAADITGNGTLLIHGAFEWRAGNIALAWFAVENGGHFKAEGNAGSFTIVAGATIGGTSTDGTFSVGGAFPGSALVNNINIGSTTIWISHWGELRFSDQNADGRGFVGTGDAFIESYGTIKVASQAKAVLDVPTWILDGLFTMGDSSTVLADSDMWENITQVGGDFESGDGCTLKLPGGYTLSGGTLNAGGPFNPLGAGKVLTIDGDFTMAGGTLKVLGVNNSFNVDYMYVESGRIEMDVNGANDAESHIHATQGFNLSGTNNAELHIRTVGQEPTEARAWQLIRDWLGEIDTTSFADHTFSGLTPAIGYSVGPRIPDNEHYGATYTP